MTASPNRGGRPRVIEGGAAHSVWLDKDNANKALSLDRSVSAGIRRALAAVDLETLARAETIGGGCALTGLKRALDLADERQRLA